MIVRQEQLFEQEGVTDYGAMGGAHAVPNLLRVEGKNPAYYAAKRYKPDFPNMMVAESVCADLATLLGLPIPPRTLITHADDLWLGFHVMPHDSKPLIPAKSDRLENPNDIPGVLAFDVLVCNWDRHEDNIILQRVLATIERYRLIMIDHSVCLGGMERDIEEWLKEPKDPRYYLSKPSSLLDRIESWHDFDAICAKLEALSHDHVLEVVNSVPGQWRPRHSDKSVMLADFLIDRARCVGELLHDSRDCFPSLRD